MDTFYGPLSVRINGVWLYPALRRPLITDSLLCPWGKKALTICISLCMPSSFKKNVYFSFYSSPFALFVLKSSQWKLYEGYRCIIWRCYCPLFKTKVNFSLKKHDPLNTDTFYSYIFNNNSSSPNGLWVNSPRGRRPNGLLTQRPWGREE